VIILRSVHCTNVPPIFYRVDTNGTKSSLEIDALTKSSLEIDALTISATWNDSGPQVCCQMYPSEDVKCLIGLVDKFCKLYFTFFQRKSFPSWMLTKSQRWRKKKVMIYFDKCFEFVFKDFWMKKDPFGYNNLIEMIHKLVNDPMRELKWFT